MAALQTGNGSSNLEAEPSRGSRDSTLTPPEVYAYDVSLGSEGCCLPGYPKHLHREFPGAALPPHLDAVYYSYTDRSMYFFKDVYYWHNVAFNPLDRRRTNKVKGPYLIASKWYDICDVE